MHYDVVYDVVRDGYAGWIGVWGGLAGLAGAAVLCRARKFLWPASLRFIPCAAIPFIAVLLLAWVVVTGTQYVSLRRALQTGQCAVVEGIVTDFQPMPSTGHGDESFSVSGVRFGYSDFSITPGFRRTNYRGGRMRAGLHVRIYYRGKDIARLEIAREQPTATSNQPLQPTPSRCMLRTTT